MVGILSGGKEGVRVGGQNWDRRIEEGKPLFVEANFREELYQLCGKFCNKLILKTPF